MFDTTSRLRHAQVNLFYNSYKPTAIKTFTLDEALQGIRLGVWREDVNAVRRTLKIEGKAAYDQRKQRLYALTFGGIFVPTRANANLRQHTGLVHGDLDHLGTLGDILGIQTAIATHPCTVYVFVSPSMAGLKVGVRVPIVADAASYAHAWRIVSAEYEQRYGGHWDASGKDVARLCFVSYDMGLYVNLQAVCFFIPPAQAPTSPPPLQLVPRTHIDHQDYAERAIRTATEMIQAAPLGSRHHTRLRAARLLGGYTAGGLLTEDHAYGALSQALSGHTEDLERALKTVEDGLRYGQAHPITLEALEAERQAWLDVHRSSTQKSDDQRPMGGSRYVWGTRYTLGGAHAR